jgi:hypothetical protein
VGGQAPFADALHLDAGTQAGVPGPGQSQAAQTPGSWNGIALPAAAYGLLDPSGLATAAEVHSSGLNGEYSYDHPGTSGGAAKLLDDLEDLGCVPGSTSTWTVSGMSAGVYEVLVYAWAPDDPTGYFTSVEVEGGSGPRLCGGVDWSGAHVEGGTYVRDVVAVAVDGGSIRVTATTAVGCGSLNGIQIVPATACGAAVTYCTAGTSASGCRATLQASGTPSASAPNGFVLQATQVEGAKDGLFFWGLNGRQASPWGNGSSLQCVVPPVRRGGLLPAAGTPGACDGGFWQDLNALWCPTCPSPGKRPGAGVTAQAQLWYRDPQSTSNQTTSLSNAIEFTPCP